MSDLVTYTSAERIATITINRADKMNALNEGVILGLQEAWLRFEASDDRVAVLHAAGDKAFSVGADIKDPPKEMWQGVPSIGATTSKPVIAAVHGWCIGGAYCIVQMEARTIEFAQELANGPQVSMRLLKRSIYKAAEMN